jgi:PHP family Zn ribbon phosphoesterase
MNVENVPVQSISEHGQKLLARVELPAPRSGEYGYVLRCQHCGFSYGVEGNEDWNRKCPKCQGGKPGTARVTMLKFDDIIGRL